eukprot:scaffold158295_cov30-Tisochrysis_lutea.AAC.1
MVRTNSAPSLASRRALLALAPAAIFWRTQPASPATNLYDELLARLDAPQLAEPAVAPSATKPPPLPGWLAGSWRCRQTLRAFVTPQGIQFIGVAGRPLSEAQASAAETRSKIGSPVELELRYLPSGDAAIEDRTFNTRSRIEAFAGRSVVATSRPCDETGQAIACVAVEYKGPANQQTLVNSARLGLGDGTLKPFALSEFTRVVFSRRLQPGDTRNFPPIITDQETLLQLTPSADGTFATGRLRLVSYLQPLNELYFAAGRRAVAISDYSLELQRL